MIPVLIPIFGVTKNNFHVCEVLKYQIRKLSLSNKTFGLKPEFSLNLPRIRNLFFRNNQKKLLKESEKNSDV